MEPESSNPADRIAMIDVVAHDPNTDEVVLIMKEEEPWDGSDERLHRLQERFNTYASFLLDGDFAEAHPELSHKRFRIDVRCRHTPDARALDLLGAVHDQLAFQDIKMEVVIREELPPGSSSQKSDR